MSFQWSFSTDKLFRRCQRQFFFREIAAHHAPKEAWRREAFILKQLKTLELWRGNVIHEGIQHYVVPSLKKGDALDWNQLSQQTIQRAQAQLKFSAQKRYFLCIASCIYAADKALPRDGAEDKWTRHLAIEIPVEHIKTWAGVSKKLSDCVGFLTGDRWEISFRHGEKRLIQKKTRKRRIAFKRPTGKAVCLFSGGLDSFIGAVDWLTDNPGEKLLLVGHYDRHVSGPGADQRALQKACLKKFAGRFELAQTQVGLSSGGVDTNFRSRSLLLSLLVVTLPKFLEKAHRC